MKENNQESGDVEDLVSRLRESEGGEAISDAKVVTREDGSQVVKVKKRKRRSRQPQKEQELKSRRKRFVLIMLLVLLFCVAGAAVLGLWAYVNSSAYEDRLLTEIEEQYGVKAEISNYRMGLGELNAKELKLGWEKATDPLLQVRLQSFRADFDVMEFLSGTRQGQSFVASTGVLVLNDAYDWSELNLDTSADRQVQFENYRIRSTSVHIGQERSEALVRDADVQYRGDRAGRILSVDGGVWAFRDDVAYSIENATLSMGEESHELSMRLQSSTGAMELESTFTASMTEEITFDASAKRWAVQHFLPENLQYLLGGTVGASVELVVNTADIKQLAEVSGELSCQGMSLAGMSFLNTISSMTGQSLSPATTFQRGVIEIERRGQEVHLVFVDLERADNFRISGEMHVARDGAVDGFMEVGVNQVFMQRSTDDKLESIFTVPRAGYAYRRIELGGTVDLITHDLAMAEGAASSRGGGLPQSEEEMEERFSEILGE